MTRLFGTDGVRGLANAKCGITARLSLKLGEAAARVLTIGSTGSRMRAVVGRDTRVSGEFLSAAVSAGLASAGVDVIEIGILPTPGIAYITSRLGVDLGVVLSASHNAMPDNGIKFFARDGYKLDDSIEDKIEELLDASWERPIGADVGRITYNHTASSSLYIEHLLSVIGAGEYNPILQGLHIVIDAANGAASAVAPEAFRLAGAKVTLINAYPDGYNINKNCGSTHPEQLQAKIVEANADFGVAFDGDADRCIAVDENGELIDGDKILTLLAINRLERGELPENTVVLTQMSNLGTLNALTDAGIKYEITGVGDRYVLECMKEKRLTLGGEQSGHIISLDHSTTGDGTLSALLLASYFMQKRKSNPLVKMSELASIVHTLPQVLINVPGVDKSRVDSDEELQTLVSEIETSLGNTGRVLLRSSGTEPLIRVMVEASTAETAQTIAETIANKVKERLAI